MRRASNRESRRQRAPAVAAGERKLYEVVDVASQNGSAGMASDLSELTALRGELQRQASSHARTLDQLSTGVAIFDRRKRLVFHNAAYRQIWSFDPAFLDQQPTDGEVLDRLRAKRQLPEQVDFRAWKAQTSAGLSRDRIGRVCLAFARRPDVARRDSTLNKLISLCNIEQNESKIELLKTINDIKLFNDSKGKMMKEFYTYYMNTANKDLILECTQSLLYLGFRMRGWLDGKDFPVKIAMVDNQAVVDLNVQEALISFEINCKKLGTDSYVIKSFPLMKYNKGFHFSNNTEDGKTVGERIELVKKGEDTQNMGSCMRLSSNYIVTTAHKMYTTLKLKEPFDIKLLRNIS